MATLRELEDALIAADEAGNIEDATMLADEIRRRKSNRASIMDPLMQGLTFGWADELGALGARLGARLAGASAERIRAAGEQEAERQRERLAQYREESPWTAAGTEIAGSLVSGGPLARGLGYAARAAGLGPKASMMTTGMLEGGLAGTGAANEDRLTGALVGAGAGGIMAGAVPALSYGVQSARPYAQALRRRFAEEPTTTAGRVLNENLRQAGVTPTHLRAAQRQLGPEAMPVDVAGPAGLGLGQQILQAKGVSAPAIADVRRRTTARAAGATGRLRRDVAGATGITGRLQPSLDAVRARQQAIAERTYPRAYDHTIPLTSKLKNLLGRRKMQQAFREAVDAADTRGEELPALFRMNDVGEWVDQGVVPDMRAWDRMKQGIDRLIDREVDPVTGRMSPVGRDLTIMKNELLTELDAINPEYAAARQLFAGDEAIQNAMREGEKFLGRSTREARNRVRDLRTESEREAYLTGAVEAIRERMGRARSGEIGQFKFLENENAKEKLRDLFPQGRGGTRQLEKLMRTLRRERLFAENRTALVGGSQTAMRGAAGEAMESGVSVPTTAEVLARPVAGTTTAALGAMNKALGSISMEAKQKLADILFDPTKVDEVINIMQQQGVPQELIAQYVNRFSRGSAALAPAAGLGMGSMWGTE